MKLSSGELTVAGDQWLLLVYANQGYNPEDSWNGLFRSQLLVWVVQMILLPLFTHSSAHRHSNIFSHHPALWRRRWKLQDLEMLTYMG